MTTLSGTAGALDLASPPPRLSSKLGFAWSPLSAVEEGDRRNIHPIALQPQFG